MTIRSGAAKLRPRAHLSNLIGEDLISDESVADETPHAAGGIFRPFAHPGMEDLRDMPIAPLPSPHRHNSGA